MIAGTSTGGLVGLGVAAGWSAASVLDLYRDHLGEIFTRRRMGKLRRGGQYESGALRALLDQRFGNDRLADLPLDVAICGSALDQFEGRVFTRADRSYTLTDVAMATAAAPTYFSPVRVQPHQGVYVDGGLWANDPTVVAVARAVHTLNIAPEQIRVLAIGTGRIANGLSLAQAKERRTYSVATLRYLTELVGAVQAWHAQQLGDQLLSPNQIERVNPVLPEWIALDDVRRSLDKLPGISDREFERMGAALVEWIGQATSEPPPSPDAVTNTLTYADVQVGCERLLEDARHFAPDEIVGINRGGAIVGGMLAKGLGIPFVKTINVNCDHKPAVVTEPVDDLRGRILLVDDACRKGEHMREAYAWLAEREGVQAVRRVVMLNMSLNHMGPEKHVFNGGHVDKHAFMTHSSAVYLPWDPAA